MSRECKTKILLLVLHIPLVGCVFRFTHDYDTPMRRDLGIYIPSVQDYSGYGGLSARLTEKIRNDVASKTGFQLRSLENSDLAVLVSVTQSNYQTQTIADCKRSDKTSEVASGAFSCDSLKRRFPHLPDISAESENYSIDARIEILKTQTGDLVFARDLKKITSATYDLLGSKKSAAELKAVPELHALRFLEQRELAMSLVGDQISPQVLAGVLASATSVDDTASVH